MAAPTDTNKRDKLAAFALMGAVLLAMAVANSAAGANYQELLLRPVTIGIAPLALTKDLLHWVNDGLMAVFFLLVGIEIKRECLVGELAGWRRAALPAFAALGGMLLPALVYAARNAGHGAWLPGWPIPTATDIAFALGILALLGSRVPATLRIFLLALAVIDDLGAIVLIALLFTSDLSWQALSMAGLCLAVLLVLSRAKVGRLWPYLLVGFLLWLSVLKSGVHATLAGVALGLALPLARGRGIDPAHSRATDAAARLEHALHPWVTFLILPVFALANAGVPLAKISGSDLTHPVTSGIVFGLVIGKLAGVFGFTWLALKLRLGVMPSGVEWRHLFGVALLTGIGFTMSLFIGSLAFDDDSLHGYVRLGVLLGSSVAAIAGLAWLRLADGAKVPFRGADRSGL
jgi:NhaA family Na+:H+ antiporter